ncbi:sigma-70 family RNA polymerase sigma factor [Sphingomonas sp. 4RDLI-65]|uniref:RNA polymerase sigma factor n=1 Tax=Sphingomonas sp. 4RDLI-65 TaxID=3111641 RepID=UPI003C275566
MMIRSVPRRSAASDATASSERETGAGIDTPDAFASAVADLLPMIRSVARRLDDRNWEDLTQETLARAWRARAQFQPGTSLKAWLLTILRNIFMTGTRAANRQVPWEEYFGDRLTQAPDQETILLDADLSAALAALTVDQRAALLSVTDGNLSYADAADQLGITMATLKTRIFRARQSVMTFLDEGSFERSAFMRIEATS